MKKLLSIFIISLLVCYTCILPVAAATPSIVIDGGAVASGGVAGGTNAKGDLTAVVASLALASQGVSISILPDSGLTALEFVKQSLEDYASTVGITFQNLCDTWLSNLKVLADGTFVFGLDNSKAIYQWLAYLTNNEKILNPANNGSVLDVGGVKCPVIMPGESLQYVMDSYDSYIYSVINEDPTYTYSVACNIASGVYEYFLICNQPIFKYRYMTTGYTSSLNNVSGSNYNGIYVYKFYSISRVGENYIPVVPDFINSIRALNGQFQIELDMTAAGDGFVGDTSQIDINDFKPSPDHLNVIDPGLHLDGIASASGKSGSVSIRKYIDALIDAINGDPVSLQVQDLDNGLIDDVPVDGYSISSASVDEDDSNVVSSGQDVIDNAGLPTAEETQRYLKHMQFNLINVFPFCIPFDIVNLLSKLDAEPVTPNVHLSFPNPVLPDPIEFDLNFTQWNDVAQVVRNAELVAFVVGLAMVTRNLIRG